jgi:1,4-alpha-glucan branching enzyme
MVEFAQKYFSTENDLLRQILDQCARELLLMESSDWQFLISTIAAKDYAELRIANHIETFDRLAAFAEKVADGEGLNKGEQKYFQELQERDRPFADVDFEAWNEM